MDFLHEHYDSAVMEASGHVQVTFLAPSIIRQTCRKPVLVDDREIEKFAGSNRAAARAISDGQVLSEVTVRERYPGPRGWRLGVGYIASSCRKKLSNLKTPAMRRR